MSKKTGARGVRRQVFLSYSWGVREVRTDGVREYKQLYAAQVGAESVVSPGAPAWSRWLDAYTRGGADDLVSGDGQVPVRWRQVKLETN